MGSRLCPAPWRIKLYSFLPYPGLKAEEACGASLLGLSQNQARSQLPSQTHCQPPPSRAS